MKTIELDKQYPQEVYLVQRGQFREKPEQVPHHWD